MKIQLIEVFGTFSDEPISQTREFNSIEEILEYCEATYPMIEFDADVTIDEIVASLNEIHGFEDSELTYRFVE